MLQKYSTLDALSKFPGAQPVSFQAAHADFIQQTQTLVCEKTDGVRFFLIETDSHHFFLVDRNYAIRHIYVYNSEQYLAQPTGSPLPPMRAILNFYDGELVRDFADPGPN